MAVTYENDFDGEIWTSDKCVEKFHTRMPKRTFLYNGTLTWKTPKGVCRSLWISLEVKNYLI